MKKFLKFILVTILVLLAGILIAGLVMPNDITVTRSALVKGTKEDVFEQIVRFKNWPNWSPFYQMDTAMKLTYTGIDGAAGSAYTWDSKNNDVGSGAMTSTNVKGTRMDYHLEFVRPYKSIADGYLKVKDSAGMAKATWSFTTHMAFPMNALQLFPFMNMDKMVGGDFERGLANLRSVTQNL